MLKNGGTRTFAAPAGGSGGQALMAAEVRGNAFAEFAAQGCHILYEHRKEFLIEPSTATGRVWSTLRGTPPQEIPRAMAAVR